MLHDSTSQQYDSNTFTKFNRSEIQSYIATQLATNPTNATMESSGEPNDIEQSARRQSSTTQLHTQHDHALHESTRDDIASLQDEKMQSKPAPIGDVASTAGQSSATSGNTCNGGSVKGDDIQHSSGDSTNQEGSNDAKADNADATFPTAFTISFDDETTPTKKLDIKDSIRKFAPPKPNTIERPRIPKGDPYNDQTLMMSIESAPGGYDVVMSSPSRYRSSGPSSARYEFNSNRSSYRRAHAPYSQGALQSSGNNSGNNNNNNQSTHISESAAFLIDKMLACKPKSSTNLDYLNHQASLQASCGNSSSQSYSAGKYPSRRQQQQQQQQQQQNSSSLFAETRDGSTAHEVDYVDDNGSDNGTYVVGTDPESEAARKKIDELFGVVKAAEASLLASASPGSNRFAKSSSSISSRERQEHINRLAHNPQRSPSATRQESNKSPSGSSVRQQQRSRNSSCDRTSRSRRDQTTLAQSSDICARASKPSRRRSVSQSSHHSHSSRGKEPLLSDNDDSNGSGSRSSLHNQAQISQLESQLDAANLSPSHQASSLKFNRAFALRRARLGLGEPTPAPAQESVLVTNRVAPRLYNIQPAPHKLASNASGSSSATNFSRDDGGRYSLRSKVNSFANRPHHRSPQHSALVDGYVNKMTNQQQQQQQLSSTRSPKHLPNNNKYAQQAHLYQAYNQHQLQNSLPHNQRPADLQIALEDRLADVQHHSLAPNMTDYAVMGEGSVETPRGGGGGTAIQLSALDSLVISAVSGLSVKIRHSVCDILMDQAKKLPAENETRSIVEEILPQLSAEPSGTKPLSSIEEVDQMLYFDLAKTLKNLKKVEQMIDVINMISSQLNSAQQQQHQQQSSSSATSSPRETTPTAAATNSSPTTSMGPSTSTAATATDIED